VKSHPFFVDRITTKTIVIKFAQTGQPDAWGF
jgi:hypothetical protein